MNYSAEQLANARIIIEVGYRLNMSSRQILAALTAALTESTLINGRVGDNGTAFGLFQQRTVSGWGPRNQLEVPEIAASKFYLGTSQNAGIANIAESGSIAQDIQTVQRSAFSDGRNYLNHLLDAHDLFNQLAGTVKKSLIHFQTKQAISPLWRVT